MRVLKSCTLGFGSSARRNATARMFRYRCQLRPARHVSLTVFSVCFFPSLVPEATFQRYLCLPKRVSDKKSIDHSYCWRPPLAGRTSQPPNLRLECFNAALSQLACCIVCIRLPTQPSIFDDHKPQFRVLRFSRQSIIATKFQYAGRSVITCRRRRLACATSDKALQPQLSAISCFVAS